VTPIAKTECYFIECDKCQRVQDAGDIAIPHFDTEGDARGDGQDHDWAFHEGAVWCEGCTSLCACGHSFLMHSYDDKLCEIGGCLCQRFEPKEARR
jgi:hypothetical protein